MMDPINLPRGIEVPFSAVQVETSRAGGPGGQHVNRTESRVTLRFDLANSPCIPDHERAAMKQRLGSRLTSQGELLVSAQAHRERRRNLEDAWKRLESLLRFALERPRRRVKTRPTRSSVERRLQKKRAHSDRKRMRRRPPSDD